MFFFIFGPIFCCMGFTMNNIINIIYCPKKQISNTYTCEYSVYNSKKSAGFTVIPFHTTTRFNITPS